MIHASVPPRVALAMAIAVASRCDAILHRGGGSAARIFAGWGRHRPVADGKDAPSASDVVKLAKDLKAATDEVKKFAEQSTKEMKNLGDVSTETKGKADEALTKMNALSARLDEVEQKVVREVGGGGDIGHKSIGQLVLEDKEVKAQLESGSNFRGRLKVEVKTITSASAGNATSSSTSLVVADRVPGVIQVVPNRPLVIRDLLMPGRTESQSIDYVRETVFTNNAAPVAENPSAPKPQSDLAFDLQTARVRTIAHWVLASQQIMADAPMLQSYIDGRLRYGISYAEDVQLLLGDGTGVNLLGLMPQATAYAKPAGAVVTAQTNIDLLRLAMLQATLSLYPATGHVLNPTDWANIELTKDTQNRYIFANPTGLAGPNLWGLPIAVSLAMPQGSFLTGAFRLAAQIFDREDANVLMSTEDRDNFVKNMVTILCEERLALCVYRPQALIKGTFPAAS